jgi:hypothetical protein
LQSSSLSTGWVGVRHTGSRARAYQEAVAAEADEARSASALKEGVWRMLPRLGRPQHPRGEGEDGPEGAAGPHHGTLWNIREKLASPFSKVRFLLVLTTLRGRGIGGGML